MSNNTHMHIQYINSRNKQYDSLTSVKMGMCLQEPISARKNIIAPNTRYI